MTLPWALALAAFIFLGIKSLFGLLGWYSRDGSDVLYRQHLDAWFDKLEEMTLFELAHGYFARWVSKVRDLVHSFKRPWLVIIGVFFCINLISYLLWSIAYFYFSYEASEASIDDYMNIGLMGGLLIPGGIFFDIISISVTWWLVKRAIASLTIFKIISHTFLDIALGILAMCWVLILFLVYTGLFTTELYWNLVNFLAILGTAEGRTVLFEGFFDLLSELWSEPWLKYFAIIMGASSVLPTLTYLVFLIPLVLFKLTPRWIHRIGSKTIYLVTTDQKPVLTQLGNVFGSLGAIFTALLAVAIASMPLTP